MFYCSFIRAKSILLFFIAISLLINRPGIAQITNGDTTQPDELYQAGLEAYQNGNTRKALKLWLDDYLTLQEAGTADSRLAIRFLQVVAADSVVEHYDTASRLYRWGMGTKRINSYQEILENELRRLELLLPHKRYNRLRRKFRDDDPGVMADIRTFWDQQDPSPSTRINERLIEHWQRINYAQNTYPGHDPYYRTNDRGLTYIRYGSPDRIEKGTINSLAFAPRYEIWIYFKELNQHTYLGFDNLVVIFGDYGDGGGFGRMESVADFLRTSSINDDRGGAQLAILNELSYIDPFFNETLADIESRFATSQVISSRYGRRIQYNQEAGLNRLEAAVGPEDSSLPPVDLQTAFYRFLDEQNQPYHIAVLYSFPHKYAVLNQQDYNYRHVFQLWGTEATMARKVDSPPIIFETIEGTTLLPAQSQFRIPHPANGFAQVFAAEYYVSGSDSADGLRLAAAGKITPAPPEQPLSGESRQLEAADLVAGYQAEGQPRGYFPFRVAYQNKIPMGDDLIFHFEIYHLQVGPQEPAQFQVVYELTKEGNFIQKLFSEDEGQGRLTLNFEAKTSRFAENIVVETSDLKPGSYELLLQIIEPSTDRSIERKLVFEIVE